MSHNTESPGIKCWRYSKPQEECETHQSTPKMPSVCPKLHGRKKKAILLRQLFFTKQQNTLILKVANVLNDGVLNFTISSFPSILVKTVRGLLMLQ
jgi:hypothetical protein